MAVRQIAESFQNDGNFCMLDLKDIGFNRPTMRIETFRCSQPSGRFGQTGVGTKVADLCGIDHLMPDSPSSFRHIFSVEENDEMKVTLEIKETFDEKGGWKITVRDLDYLSESFGTALNITVSPTGVQSYFLNYSVINERLSSKKVLSPLTAPIAKITGLKDIGNLLTTEENILFSDDVNLNLLDEPIIVNSKMASIRNFVQKFLTFTKNVKAYQRFGDFRDKCVHDGTNLTGANAQLASEYLLIRAYRSSLTYLGAVFDEDMYLSAGDSVSNSEEPLSRDPKPGVYTPFLNAYILGIGIYKLGLDKVHSSYSGVPLKLAPGSRLENGMKPTVDSSRANETIADLAALFFQPQILPLKLKYELV